MDFVLYLPAKQVSNGGCSLLGLGGHPVRLPMDSTNLSSFCGPVPRCTGNETGQDGLICSQCRCPGYSPVYSPAQKCSPCLFDVLADPGETQNLASAMPDRLSAMTERLLNLRTTMRTVPAPPKDLAAACQAMVSAGGYCPLNDTVR